MKRILLIFFGVIFHLSFCTAQVADAFQGILPVTDPQVTRSLNGVWDVKVSEEIVVCAEGVLHQPVPGIDSTWTKIPVPGCWEAYGLCKPKYDSTTPLTGFYRRNGKASASSSVSTVCSMVMTYGSTTNM